MTLVTGDAATCNEARRLLGDVLATVAVKRGLSRSSARMIPPARARSMITTAAANAVSNPGAVRPYDPGRPAEIEVTFVTPDGVEQYRNQPGVEVTGPCSIVSRADDWWLAWSQFYL